MKSWIMFILILLTITGVYMFCFQHNCLALRDNPPISPPPEPWDGPPDDFWRL